MNFLSSPLSTVCSVLGARRGFGPVVVFFFSFPFDPPFFGLFFFGAIHESSEVAACENGSSFLERSFKENSRHSAHLLNESSLHSRRNSTTDDWSAPIVVSLSPLEIKDKLNRLHPFSSEGNSFVLCRLMCVFCLRILHGGKHTSRN